MWISESRDWRAAIFSARFLAIFRSFLDLAGSYVRRGVVQLVVWRSNSQYKSPTASLSAIAAVLAGASSVHSQSGYSESSSAIGSLLPLR